MQANSPNARPFFRQRWFTMLAAVIALFGLLLVTLPLGISYGLHKWLLQRGGDAVQLGDVDFNVFTGRAALQNLQVTTGERQQLVIPGFGLDVDWSPLFSRMVVVRSVSLQGVRLEVNVDADGVMTVGGIGLPEGSDEAAGEEGAAWGFELDHLDISDATIIYRTPQLQLEIQLDEFSLSDLGTWETEPAPIAVKGAVNGAALQLDGQLPPLSEGTGYAGYASLHELPLDIFAALAGEAISGLVGRLTVDTDLNVLQSEGKPLAVTQSGRIRVDGLALEQAGNQLGTQQLLWNGTTTVSLPASGDLQVELRGAVTGNGLTYLQVAGTAVDYKLLQWDGTASVSMPAAGGAVRVALHGGLEGNGLAISQAGNELAYESLRWDGAASVTVPGNSSDVHVDLSGKVNGNNLALVLPEQALEVQHGKFLWDGEVAVIGGETAAVSASGHLNIGSLAADVAGRKVQLARVEDLDIQKVSLQDTGDIALENLVLTGAVFAKEAAVADGEPAGNNDSVLVAGAISTNSVQVTDGNQVSIDTLEWRDITSVIRREADGQWRVVRITSTLPFANQANDTPPAVLAAPEAGKPAGRVRVGELRIAGNSAILFSDMSTQPPVSMRLALEQAVLKGIDSGAPDQDSPITVQGSLDKHSRIDIQGTMRPFAAQPSLDLKNHLEGIPLTLLSPYTAAAIGYELRSGQLEADATLRVDNRQLDSQNKLVIRGLEVRPAGNKSQEQFDSQLPVPLGTALGMLRDKNNTITLDMPVSGAIDNPDFDISSVINTAVSKAVKSGSLTYLKIALQPYGALITVAQLAGEAASRVRLQPVMFAPGSAENLADSLGYMEKVAGILKARPAVNIKICGLAVEEDRTALAGPVAKPAPEAGKDKPVAAAVTVSEAQLLELASQRAEAVKDYLVTGHGVAAGRLVACQPQVESADVDDAPRVELLI